MDNCAQNGTKDPDDRGRRILRFGTLQFAKSGVAFRRLGLLGGKEFSSRLGPTLPTAFPFRVSHLSKLEAWASQAYSEDNLQQWADLIDSQNQSLVWMVRPRVDKAQQYEQSLTNELKKCLQQQSVSDTLRNIDEQWQKINTEVDPKFQELVSLEGLGIR